VNMSDELKEGNILKLLLIVRFACAILDVGHLIVEQLIGERRMGTGLRIKGNHQRPEARTKISACAHRGSTKSNSRSGDSTGGEDLPDSTESGTCEAARVRRRRALNAQSTSVAPIILLTIGVSVLGIVISQRSRNQLGISMAESYDIIKVLRRVCK
jgi:hypothetical protein